MHISVTAMATDSAVTALSVATTFTMICTSMFHNVDIIVTALSVVTDVTLVCTVMLQRCHCHRCFTVGQSTNVDAIAVTVLSRPLLSQHS